MTDDEQPPSRPSTAYLGPAIVAARKATPRVPWKELARLYGVGVRKLQYIWAEATGRNHIGCPKCGHRFSPSYQRARLKRACASG